MSLSRPEPERTQAAAWKRAARWAVACLLIGWLVSQEALSFEPLTGLARRPEVVAALVGLLAGVTLVAALRWSLFVGPLVDMPRRYPTLLGMLWSSQFLGQALPSTLGTDALRALELSKRHDVALDASTHSVIVDRVTSLLGLVLLALAFGVPALLKARPESTVTVVGGVVVGSALVALGARFLVRRLGGSERWARLVSRPVIAKALVLSVLAHGLKAACMITIIVTTLPASALTPLELLAIASCGLLVEALPVAPSGLGTGHAAFEVLLSAYGVPLGAGAYTVYFIVKMVVRCFGALPFMARR